MNRKLQLKTLEDFYWSYDEKNPIAVFIAMTISLGFYIITWIYFLNKELAKYDPEAPNPDRGALIMFFIPLSWYITTIVISKLFLINFPSISFTINFLGWILVIFLGLKYLYDFCISFANITKSNALLWYLFIYPGFLAYVLAFFNFFYTFPFIFFTIIAIPSMQDFMNNRAKEIQTKRQFIYFNGITSYKPKDEDEIYFK